MNGRERLAKTLEHEEPDKVPIDLGGFQTGIHFLAYKKLIDHLGIIDDNILFYDWLQQLVIPCDELLERFQVDTRSIHLPSTFMTEKEGEAKEVNERNTIGFWDKFGIFWGRDAENPTQRLIYNTIVSPFEDFTTEQQVRDYDWPDGKDHSLLKGLREYARQLHGHTGYALVGRSMGCLFQWTHYLFGFARAMKYMLTKPKLIAAAMEGLVKYFSDFAIQYMNEVGEYIQTVQITSDLSDQSGPLINPRLYRKLIQPYEAEFANLLHELGDVKINYHCCGAASAFFPDFIKNGYNCINPVQISANGMEPCSLKARFGKDLVFWGGACNNQGSLAFGTPEDVRQDVKYNVECLKPGGGFIAANVHNIVYNVPAENIIAMFDAIIEFRDYERKKEGKKERKE
ncbi:MAG: uroporphyrinogen decarboxylase family protein [Promethearchaeota archaeon]